MWFLHHLSYLYLNRFDQVNSLDDIAYFGFLQNWYDRYNELKVRYVMDFRRYF